MAGRTHSPRGRMLQAQPSGEGYFTWQVSTVAVRGLRLALVSKPGVFSHAALDPAAALLAERVEVGAAQRVLDLQCGSGLVGAVLATLAPGASVQLADSSVVAVEAARRTLEANQLVNAHVHLSSGTRALDLEQPSDVVSMRLPQGKARTLQLVWDAFLVLKVGGRLYLAGGKREGVKTCLRQVEALFGNLALIAYQKGHRLGVAQKRSASPAGAVTPPLEPGQGFQRFQVRVRGLDLVVCSRPGVFSWAQLDEGTRLLLEALEVGEARRVLDLGCGYGIIGATAAALAPGAEIVLLDADVDAVEAARATLTANRLENAQALLSDCGEAVRGQAFDLVVTNPPFHRGKGTARDVALQFIADAAALLRPGGRLLLVANRFLPYERAIEAAFGNVETVYADPRYKLLGARRASPLSAQPF